MKVGPAGQLRPGGPLARHCLRSNAIGGAGHPSNWAASRNRASAPAAPASSGGVLCGAARPGEEPPRRHDSDPCHERPIGKTDLHTQAECEHDRSDRRQ